MREEGRVGMWINRINKTIVCFLGARMILGHEPQSVINLTFFIQIQKKREVKKVQ